MGISCDICKYGESHDYVNGNYYCRNNNCIHRGGDFPMIHDCADGEIDQWSYDFKYSHIKVIRMYQKS